MNKVVPSIMAISAVLFTAGCASSGVKGGHSNYAYQANNAAAYNANYRAGGAYSTHAGAAHAGQYQQVACQTCGAGSHAVAHDHGHSRSHTGQTVTHRHAGAAGHAHNGMSGSHSYVTTTAGRNTGGYVTNAGYANQAGAGVARAGGSGVGSTLVKAAGALIVGGLIYNAVKDDDDDNGSSVSTPVVDDK
ncbi:hypothetical protein EOL70_02890 [Leucothrix sargassi]|nr:hypothetical protein EOL70_02890 [Leucothrix sargassi]